MKVLFIRDRQKWNSFVIRVDRDLKIKDLLLDDLNFSVRSISKMKRDKNIYKNGQVAKPTSMAKTGDIQQRATLKEPWQMQLATILTGLERTAGLGSSIGLI